MTKNEAQYYIWNTDWHELIRIATGQPVPEDVQKKRKQAYEVLKAQ